MQLMRYKVRADSDAAFHKILGLLEDTDAVEVLLTSPRRRMMATSDLPPAYQEQIRCNGGEIVEDPRYELETRL